MSFLADNIRNKDLRKHVFMWANIGLNMNSDES